ncbi:four helix bundle protein [Patescibacteria group bacterium]|nr:four helix bundle protein [Patescibacteria group bacterium]MBU1123853.1 four helix bundle protein [Patescibacteria group bacterium]MBU1910798.1 four helix bundle protein [Patescibacteria group bacterium]
MAAFRFKNFKVYKDAKAFRKDVMKLVAKLEEKRAYDLAKQIKRASLSIVLNIAEGSAKKSDADFARFLENSIGSTSEVVAGFDISCDENLISKEEYDYIEKSAESITNQLGGFIKSLRKSR